MPSTGDDLDRIAKRRSNTLVIEKASGRVLLTMTDEGIFITHGWIVQIKEYDAHWYYHNFDRNIQADIENGFYFDGEGYTLSHRHAKIYFTKEEVAQVRHFFSDYLTMLWENDGRITPLQTRNL